MTCSNSEDATSFGVMTSAYAEKKQWMKDRDLMGVWKVSLNGGSQPLTSG